MSLPLERAGLAEQFEQAGAEKDAREQSAKATLLEQGESVVIVPVG